MSERKWFQKSYRRLLVDMHIPDWNEDFLKNFSPDNYAEMMKLANIDTAEIYAGNCLGLCFWPTNIGVRHKALERYGRDIFGETIDACKRRGIEVQIYINVWCRAIYDLHPEWRIEMFDGRTTCEQEGCRYGLCCHNTGYKDYFLALVDELNSMYEGVGFWIDMIGNFHVCYCHTCQKRFRDETGFDRIPRIADWNDPAWRAFDKCRARWLTDFAKDIRATIVNRRPDATVTFQSAPIKYGRGFGTCIDYLHTGDFLAGDFTGDKIEQSVITKLFTELSPNRPMEFMTPRCETLSYHTSERPLANLKMRAYSAIANQCSFTLIDAIDPAGTLDKRFYLHANEINTAYSKFQKYLSPESKSCSDIGIYYSYESTRDPELKPLDIMSFQRTPSETFREINATLQNAHCTFRFVTAKDVAEVPVVFMSDCSVIHPEEAQAIRDYVANGGTLIATYRTSLFSPDDGKLDDFQLADVFGVHAIGKTDCSLSYIKPVDDTILAGVTSEYPIMIDSDQMIVSTEADAEVLAHITLPISHRLEIHHFGSAISNPPLVETDHPSIVVHNYGKGKVIYIAGKIEAERFQCHKEALVSIIDRALKERHVITKAPKCVEVTLYQQEEQNRLVLSATNLPAELPPLPIHGVTFEVKVPATVKSVTLGPDDTPVPFTQWDGHISFHIERLEEFALFCINF